jgi:hypothetical protein
MWKNWKMKVILMAFVAIMAGGCVFNTEGVDIKKTTIDTSDVDDKALSTSP